MKFPKDGTPGRILGTIFFSHGKVIGVTRPLGEEDFTAWNSGALGFARTLYRALAPESGDTDATVNLSVRHERETNAETEVLTLTFKDGRGIRMSLIRLDKPFPDEPPETKDQVTLEEFLGPPLLGSGR